MPAENHGNRRSLGRSRPFGMTRVTSDWDLHDADRTTFFGRAPSDLPGFSTEERQMTAWKSGALTGAFLVQPRPAPRGRRRPWQGRRARRGGTAQRSLAEISCRSSDGRDRLVSASAMWTTRGRDATKDGSPRRRGEQRRARRRRPASRPAIEIVEFDGERVRSVRQFTRSCRTRRSAGRCQWLSSRGGQRSR